VINVAICGFGFMGATHARCLAGLSQVRLRAIADKDLVNLQSAGRGGNLATTVSELSLDGVSLHTDMEEVLAMPEIDAVHICLPLHLHEEWTRRTLNAGKHVFLEKPMLLDPSRGPGLIDLARRKGLIVMVGHVVRFMPAYRKLKAYVTGGELGSLEFLLMQRWTGVPSWGMWKDPESRRTSGGGLFDLLIHDIDCVRWLLGTPSHIQSSVFAGPVSDHDFVSAVWRYEGGPSAVLNGGFAFHARLPFESGFVARFTNATVAFDSARPGVLNIAGAQDLDTVNLEEDPLDGYRREIEYFLTCVSSGRWPEECSPESSLEAVELALRHLPGKSVTAV
jgi:predicted dehydrogenase